MRSRRLVTYFEGLNSSSSIAWQLMELQSVVKMWAERGISKYKYFCALAVNNVRNDKSLFCCLKYECFTVYFSSH